MDKDNCFAALYANMQAILEHPESDTECVTEFSAGGYGAKVYGQNITAAELVGCWQFKEYRIVCPTCGELAYITKWAGSIGSGGYWMIKAYCPHCDSKIRYHRCRPPVANHNVDWSKMADIVKEVKEALASHTDLVLANCFIIVPKVVFF